MLGGLPAVHRLFVLQGEINEAPGGWSSLGADCSRFCSNNREEGTLVLSGSSVFKTDMFKRSSLDILTSGWL